jgi:hypothetical protein
LEKENKMVSQNFKEDELNPYTELSAKKKLVDLLFIPTSFIRFQNRNIREGKFNTKEGESPKGLNKIILYAPPTMLEGLRICGYEKVGELLCNALQNYF